jgi:hypothetical protein
MLTWKEGDNESVATVHDSHSNFFLNGKEKDGKKKS